MRNATPSVSRTLASSSRENAHFVAGGADRVERRGVRAEDLALQRPASARVAVALLELGRDLEGAERLDLVLR